MITQADRNNQKPLPRYRFIYKLTDKDAPVPLAHPNASDVGRQIKFVKLGQIHEYEARIAGIQGDQWITNWRGDVRVDPEVDQWRFIDDPAVQP